MQVAKIIDNTTVGEIGEITSLFPNVSFPSTGVDDEFLAENSLLPVFYVADFDSNTQKLVPTEPYISGNAVYTFNILEKTQEDINTDLANERSAKTAEIRLQRDQLLKDSDWTQVADAPTDKVAWATYRQELRDITQQEGFPFNVIFPTPPL